MYGVAGVLLLVSVLALARKEKRVAGLNKLLFLIPLAVGGLLVVGQLGLIPQIYNPSPVSLGTGTPIIINQPGAGTTGTGGILEICDQSSKTTVTLSAKNAYTGVAPGGTHKYSINGAPSLTVSDGGTFSASPSDKLDVLFLNGSATGTYIGDSKLGYIVPCKGADTISSSLYQNGTITVEVFNEEGNLIDTAGENETIGNGDVVTLKGNLKGQYQRGFSNGGVVVAEWNKTVFDDVIVEIESAPGSGSYEKKQVAVPVVFSPTLGTESARKAYAFNSLLDNAILAEKITLDAHNTNNPGTAGDPTLTVYVNAPYIDENDGGKIKNPSIEDETNAITYQHTTVFTINVD